MRANMTFIGALDDRKMTLPATDWATLSPATPVRTSAFDQAKALVLTPSPAERRRMQRIQVLVAGLITGQVRH
ncbi:hypothetical protein EA795_02600 [Stutzerimonas nitrititolerans]|uniref:Uncharacterized protein n=1 Tax=Stutzerimonas nitrititolerans TaxID=2482751 RepID=A0ABX9VA97_9GAMM|nr:hypothetical protein EA795_02600 [Stutzerimonas nitrititolerans]